MATDRHTEKAIEMETEMEETVEMAEMEAATQEAASPPTALASESAHQAGGDLSQTSPRTPLTNVTKNKSLNQYHVQNTVILEFNLFHLLF